MASREYIKANLRQFMVNLNKEKDSALIEWVEFLKSKKLSMNLIITAALYEFMDKHEFDTVEELKEYISKE